MGYDAFISYSHAADGRLAPALQRGLQRLAKPWNRRRALNVFRDETGLSTNPHLWSSVQAALDDSEWFILLASPEAAASEWVNKEVEHWLAARSADHILPVVSDGTWSWDAGARDYSLDSTAVPAALRGAFRDEPRHLDLRWARTETDLDLRNSRFRDAIADLAAPLHGLPKDELEGEDIRQHRRTRRLARGGVSVLTLLVVIAFITTAFAFVQRDHARTQSRVATAGRLAALASVRSSSRLDQALLLAVEGNRADDTPESRSGLINALATSPNLLRLRHPWSGDSLAAAASPDGTRFVTLGADGSAQVFDARSARALTSSIRALDAPLSAGAFSPDDNTLVVASSRGLRVLDVSSGRPVGQPVDYGLNQAYGGGLAFSPDGSTFVTIGLNGGVQRFSSPAATPVGEQLSLAVNSAGAFTADGAIVVAGDTEISIANPVSGAVIRGPRPGATGGGVSYVAATMDAGLLAVGEFDGDLTLYDLPQLSQHGEPLRGHTAAVNTVRFNADGSRLVSASEDGTVIVWDARTGTQVRPPFVGHSARVLSAWFEPGGGIESVGPSELATWTPDVRATFGPVVAGHEALDPVFPAGDEVAPVDANTVAVASDDGTVSLRDVHTGREVAPKFQSGHNRSGDLAVTRDGSRIALGTADADANNNVSGGAIVVWQRSNRSRIEVPGAVQWSELEFSPDGRSLAFLSGLGGDDLAVVDARSGKARYPAIRVHSPTRTISFVVNPGVAFSPDGKLLVVGAVDGPVTVWNALTGKLVRRVGATRSPTSALAFDHSGTQVAVATRDGHVQLYEVSTGRSLGEPMVVNGVYATHLAFSESSEILAIGASDGGVTLWDLRTHALLGRALSGHGEQVNGIVIIDHDRILVTGAGDGTVAFRSLSPATWQRQACALAGRNLTKAEWRQFLGNRAYHKTCAQWPAGK